MGQLLGPDFPSEIGLAVSGGGDSMAMLSLAHNWTRVWGVGLWVATVDHGLRSESAEEAALVAETCAELGWPHATLRWHWDGAGNVMDAARRGRLSLIDAWRGRLRHVLMAHTRDDVAETFLMRLARGSGIEGLSAMAAARAVRLPETLPGPADHDGALPPRADSGVRASDGDGFVILRPCLDMTRSELRHYLRTLKGRWVEDPTNTDPAYERARVRRALAVLEEQGIEADTLAATAHRLTRARQAVCARANDVWQRIGQEERVDGRPTGDILLERDGFAAVERDTQLRLLAAALQWVSGAEYRPRAAPLEALLDALLAGGGGTLSGCEARADRETLRIFREYVAVRHQTQSADDARLWDGRWRIAADMRAAVSSKTLEIRALGDDGWAQIPDRPAAPPHVSARSLPALWQSETLLACPALGIGEGVAATLCPMGRAGFGLSGLLDTH
jgi:tRNA(Ile)-lysidine synthase